MNVVDLNVCTSLMLSTVLSICAQGEELIPATSFRYRLASPILNVISRMFVQKVSKTANKATFLHSNSCSLFRGESEGLIFKLKCMDVLLWPLFSWFTARRHEKGAV